MRKYGGFPAISVEEGTERAAADMQHEGRQCSENERNIVVDRPDCVVEGGGDRSPKRRYLQLIRRAYQAMFEQNERFRAALMQTRGITLVHTSGEPSSYKTILTPSEFCGILMDLRDSYSVPAIL